MKNVVTGILLVFVAGSIVFLVVSETRKPAAAETAGVPSKAEVGHESNADQSQADTTPPLPATRATVTAYYFHGTMRCPTCLKMERYARAAIEEAFAAELDAGLLAWQAPNYDETANEHFVKEYGLAASALVLVAAAEEGENSWRNLERIWKLVGDEPAFKAYVVDAVTAMLREQS